MIGEERLDSVHVMFEDDKAEKALDKALLGGARFTSAWWQHQ